MSKYFWVGWMLGILSILPSSVAAEGRSVRTSYDLGVFAFAEGDYATALDYFQQAVAGDGKNPDTLHFVGKTLLALERPRESLGFLQRATAISSQVDGLQYDLATAHFRLGNYDQAALLFVRLADQEPQNALARYYAGMSSFKQQDYGAAVENLDRAALANASLRDNASYHAGIALYRLGQDTEAVARLQDVQAQGRDAALRDMAAHWLAVIRDGAAEPAAYAILVKLGLEYDDNVRLEPLDDDLFADEGDLAAIAYLAGRYNLLDRHSLRLGVGYSHYQTLHDDLGQFDLTGSLLSFYLHKNMGPFTGILTCMPAYYWLDSESYLRRWQLQPELLWRVGRAEVMRLAYSYADDDYFQNPDREGSRHEFALDVYSDPGAGKMKIDGGLGYERKSAAHADQSYGGVKARLGLTRSLAWAVDLGLSASYYGKQYDDSDSVYGGQRHDDRYSVALTLTRPLGYDWLRCEFGFRFVRNDSNLAVYAYDKKVTTLAIVTKY